LRSGTSIILRRPSINDFTIRIFGIMKRQIDIIKGKNGSRLSPVRPYVQIALTLITRAGLRLSEAKGTYVLGEHFKK
jgi:hypothetical protein